MARPKVDGSRRYRSPREPDLGDQLRDAIDTSGRSASEVARLADLDPAIVIRFLSGQRDIRLGTAGLIARALGYQLAEVGRGRGRPPTNRKSERAESSEVRRNAANEDDHGPEK